VQRRGRKETEEEKESRGYADCRAYPSKEQRQCTSKRRVAEGRGRDAYVPIP